MPGPDTASTPAHPVLRRVFSLLFLLVLLCAVSGFLYENVSEARDRRFNPMTGRRFDVGGFKMHMDCIGEGSPVVILDSGLGDTYISWRKVQPQIAKFTRVCSYDRAGLGYSDSSPRPRTSRSIAEELHALLLAASVPPPYVLVGHSMAGYDVRIYSNLYPKEVAGMVLVDASHPDQENRFPPELKNMEASWLREAEFLAYTMPFGVPRVLGFCDEDPPQRAAECNFHTAEGAVAELKTFRESAQQASQSGALGNIPLEVLSHDPDKPSAELPPDVAKPTNEAWEKMQEELAHLSARGMQKIVKGSSHYIQIDDPEVVIDAVRTTVDEVHQTAPAGAKTP